MRYEEAMAYIHHIDNGAKPPTLQRITALCTALGNPQDALPFVHIAGTNGKGSTAAMMAEILRRSGYRTGLYLSPYLEQFEERISIDGQNISRDALAACAQQVQQAALTLAEELCPSEFEIVTAIAFLYFRAQSCDVVVLETGLGGRFDATNVIGCPLASVITQIDLDHTALLGDSVAKIAGEKCGIIKSGGRTAVYAEQPYEAMRVIERTAEERENTLYCLRGSELEIRESGIGGSNIRLNGRDYRIGLGGRYQIQNALTVLAAVDALRDAGMQIPDQAVREGLENARIPARLERFDLNPQIVLDGAHNPAGIRALREAIDAERDLFNPLVVLTGMLRDKDYAQSIRRMAECADAVICTTPESPRALSAEDCAAIAAERCPDVRACGGLSDALEAAIRRAGSAGTVFVCGSLFLAGPVRSLLRKKEGKKRKATYFSEKRSYPNQG